MIYKTNEKKIMGENLQSKFPSNKLKTNKAFVSMIALLLANVFLAIGLSVFNIALREIILSSGARESLFAFYAADSGMECALYWDIKKSVFSTDTASGDIDCSGQTVEVDFIDCGVDCSRNIFSLNYPPGSLPGACVRVEVIKLNETDTQINSFGQNTCNTTNKRRVERAWKVRY